jgi:hypothetical protein
VVKQLENFIRIQANMPKEPTPAPAPAPAPAPGGQKAPDAKAPPAKK